VEVKRNECEKKLNHPGFKTNVLAENAKLENFSPGMGSNEACLLPNTTQPKNSTKAKKSQTLTVQQRSIVLRRPCCALQQRAQHRVRLHASIFTINPINRGCRNATGRQGRRGRLERRDERLTTFALGSTPSGGCDAATTKSRKFSI
jgi:hypothetical protein